MSRPIPASLLLLGTGATVYRNKQTGALVVDTDSIRDPGDANGHTDTSGVDFGGPFDDFGYLGDDLGDDLGDGMLGDYLGDDLGDGMLGDDLGARKHHGRRAKMKAALEAAVRRELESRRKWVETMVTGAVTLAAAGPGQIQIRMQTPLKAKDITFDPASLANSTVNSVFFGDRLIWNANPGVNISIFATSGYIRGFLKDQDIPAGIDILVNVSLPGAGTVTAIVFGKKPQNC